MAMPSEAFEFPSLRISREEYAYRRVEQYGAYMLIGSEHPNAAAQGAYDEYKDWT